MPAEARYILVDEHQWGPDPRGCAIPFLERNGEYWGAPPDDETAIRELERLRGAGAAFIVFGWPAFWWIDHYSGLQRHLRDSYTQTLVNERVVVFDLGAERADQPAEKD